jgi:hypothetical protein
MPEPIPANEPIPVILARDSAAAVNAPVVRPAVAVVPVHSTWNDFGNFMAANLYIYSTAGAVIELGIRFMFEGVSRTEPYLLQLLGSRPWIDIAEVHVLFCSVLTERESYGRIVEALGFNQAVTALRQLGDAVVLRLEGSDTLRLAMLETPGFHLGALREDSAFVAFRRGGRYLRPQPFTVTTDAATSFRFATNIPAADNVYEINFDFEPDELSRNRVFVLIGCNGAGKTQLLLSIIQNLRSPPDVLVAQQAQFEPLPSFNRVLVFSSVASDLYPRSIPPWQGIDYQYFSMTASHSAGQDALTSALVDCLRDDGKIRFYQADIFTFTGTGRMALLEKALAPLNIWPSIHLPLKVQSDEYDLGPLRTSGERQFFPLERWRNLNEQRSLLLVRSLDWTLPPVIFGSGDQLRSLSSGEFAMLRFAAQAAGSVEPGCLFLFDEPETHLHPNFISDFMDVLHILVTETRSAAIIATHSAYIVREAPRQRVRILSVVDREVSIDMPRLQTFGSSIDSISQFVFGDTNISHRYQNILDEWLSTLGTDITIEKIVELYGQTMNSETLSYVAQRLRNRKQ